MSGKWAGKWAGGRISRTGAYVIEKMVAGRQRSVTLKVHTEQEALAELALFNRDREQYLGVSGKPLDGPAKREPVSLGPALRLDFEIELVRRDATPRYRTAVTRSLLLLEPLLPGPLEALSRDQVVRAFESLPDGAKVAFKSLCSWLMDTGRLDSSPGRWIKVKPARRSVVRKGYYVEEIDSAYERLAPEFRPALIVQASIGCHCSELVRIASKHSSVTIEPRGRGSEIAAVVQFWHKSSKPHRVSISAPVLEAVLALHEGPEFNLNTYYRALYPVRPGQLRHSLVSNREKARVVRWTEGGASLEEVAEVLGHSGTRVTSKHYSFGGTPPMVVIPYVWQRAVIQQT